jgi:hypothetical protein
MNGIRLATVFAISAIAPLAAAQDSPEPDARFGQWIAIFDGTGFEGWEVSKPAGAEFNWKIEDGVMTNVADPGRRKHNIATTRRFHNFEARLEFKISPGGNAGVYLRGRAEVQIFDSHGKAELDATDMGALYRYAPPLVDATRPAGEWNQLEIRFVGKRLDVVLNGKLVQNNAYIAQRTGQGRTDEFDSPGMFELQGDHDQVWFRNVRIRPLFEAEGWRRLTNDADMTGWKPYRESAAGRAWPVEEGALTNLDAPFDIITEEVFGDFLVHYEYKSVANSGFYLRNLWEIQIMNSHGKAPTRNSDGALYDFFPPLKTMTRPDGQWNVVEAKVVGRKITAFQNGELIHHEREVPARTYNRNDASNLDAPGPFLLQGDHGRVWFANVWVLPLEGSK